MNEAVFMEQVHSLMENGQEFDMDEPLEDIPDWDSLTMIQFTLMARREADKALTVRQLAKCRTLREVYALVR